MGKMLRLPPYRGFPVHAKPGKILVDRGLEFRPAPDGVDILDAQQEATAARAREIEIQQRRISVAEMQKTVRARREAEDGWH